MPADLGPFPERSGIDGHPITCGAMGHRPPAVLLHGTPFSSVVWQRFWASDEWRPT